MKVIDEGRAAWFLFERGDELLLDVNCSHSAVGYGVLLRLDEREVAEYGREGRAFVDRLARDVQDRGPGSSLQRRNIGSQYDEEAMAAVTVWRLTNPQPID